MSERFQSCGETPVTDLKAERDRLKETQEQRCIAHAAFNPSGDCVFCDYEQSEALVEELVKALAQLVRAVKYTSGVSLEFATKEAAAALARAREAQGEPGEVTVEMAEKDPLKALGLLLKEAGLKLVWNPPEALGETKKRKRGTTCKLYLPLPASGGGEKP